MSHIQVKRMLERHCDEIACVVDEGERNTTISKMYLYCFVPPKFITAQKHVEH